MTLQQLRYAIEIANCGSMNEAAKRLFISQPSLSNAIKELESELGITIFDRTNRGISLSVEGVEFLGYARQMIEQAELIESRYHGQKRRAVHFAVSSQHYAFAAEAFGKLLELDAREEYNFHLRETQTFQIIEDVRTLRSEVGILYINERNSRVMNKLFSDSNLKFTPLFNAAPYIFLGERHPLAREETLSLEQVKEYPYISFDQGDNNSPHFSEEVLSFTDVAKSIKVNDRATLSDLLLNTNGYTVGTGILATQFNGEGLQVIPFESEEVFTVGWIAHKDRKPSDIAGQYIDLLNDLVQSNYLDIHQFLL
ncbi:LysR family transcriptional regulator [Paenibacillus sp. JX-17]|uniref:LysR family transcriptional regulator n=1 Tax=Paenibacillus lacisoli TaxID=3064525 RepID=A0ABT9CA84_9BACL|nr:LysR family transcriptional regulator [Paenibacillus sp. JX-17]MDO7905559.1 LysR family transcriptional regulator [Paenibacillus sp. JX-17]